MGFREESYLYLTGRAKDIIISGGTNISPREIEEILLQNPPVAEAMALPIPDSTLGEVIRAVVAPRGGLSKRELLDGCSTRLAKCKQPRSVRIIHEPLPRNAMQKLDRKRAKGLYGRD